MTEESVPRRLWSALWSEPLQTLGGFLMLVIGVALAFSDGWEKIAGAVLVAGGGVLITSAMSVAFARESALASVRKRLVALNQTIATACGHIEAAADGLDDWSLDDETVCAVIANALQYLTAAGSQIQDIVGEKLDSGALAQTARDFKQLQSALESAHDSAVQSGSNEAAVAIQNVQSQLQEFKGRLSVLTEREDVSVICPYCTAAGSVSVGKASGSSAMPTCVSCGQRFHVHRRADGEVFARPHGRKVREIVTTLECPGCGDRIVMRTGPDDVEPQTRWCLNCYLRQTIDPLQGMVTDYSGDEPLDGTAVGIDGTGHSLVVCPSCSETLRSFARRSNDVFAVCYSCDRLVRAHLTDPAVGDSE